MSHLVKQGATGEVVPDGSSLWFGLSGFNTLLLTHGVLPVNEDGVGIMHDAIQDGIGQSLLSDFAIPALGGKLRYKNS